MTKGRAGAPRSERSRLAILRAAADLVDEKGFDAITIEGIAARAGVGKQTIYRWYPSKSAVLVESLIEGVLFVGEFALHDTGDLRTDLTVWMSSVYSFIAEGTNVQLLTSLLSAAIDDPAVARSIGERLGATGPAILDRLERCRDAGELTDDFSPDLFLQAMFGAIVVRALAGLSFTPHDAVTMVDFLLGRAVS